MNLKPENNLHNFLHLLRVVTYHQLLDRMQTTSYWIGAFIQPISIVTVVATHHSGIESYLRAMLISTLTILFLAAKGGIQNEIKFGTAQYLFFGIFKFDVIILGRSLANALVSLPSVLIPLIAWFIFGEGNFNQSLWLVFLSFCVMINTVGLYLILTGFLNSTPHLEIRLQWCRHIFLLLGVGVLPFEFINHLALFFPTGQLLLLAKHNGQFQYFFSFIGVLACWLLLTQKLFKGDMLFRINRYIETGKI